MAKSKKEQAMMLDPNRFKIAQQNAVMPGGPPNQQGNPMNITSVGPQPASTDGISQHPYGDTGNKYPQMGADVLNPVMVGRSNLPQMHRSVLVRISSHSVCRTNLLLVPKSLWKVMRLGTEQ